MLITFFFLITVILLSIFHLFNQTLMPFLRGFLFTILLFINFSKTKYMFISFKPSLHFSSFPPLFLSGSPLDRVNSFTYLGLVITSNLSWSAYIQSISCKSRQLIGILYRLFYHHSSSSTLLLSLELSTFPPQRLFLCYLSFYYLALIFCHCSLY